MKLLTAILVSFTICCIPQLSAAQPNAIDSLIQEVEAYYDTLDLSSMQTNYFLNRGFLFPMPFEQWKDSSSLIFNPTTWDAVREPFMRTAGSITIPNLAKLDSIHSETYPLDESISTIGIGIMFMKGEFVRDTILKLVRDSGHSVIFEPFNFLAVAPFREFITQGTVRFKTDPSTIFSPNIVSSLEVDFDDGLGFRQQSLNGTNVSSVTYNQPGEKNLIFRVVDQAGDTTVSYSQIDVLGIESVFQGAVYGSMSDSTDTTVSGIRSVQATTGIEWLYFQGKDGKRNKPVIFVEGFDVTNTTGLGKSSAHFAGYRKRLNNAGFDVYITNFKDGTISLFDNTNHMKSFIKNIIHGAGFVEKHEGMMIGLSMGGIISRMTLKQLENEGYDHQIGFLITSDTPHKGASVSLSIQSMAIDLASNLPYWILTLSKVWDIYASIFPGKYPSKQKVFNAIHSAGAKQMLARHYQGDQTHVKFQNYLDTLGWPALSRNITLLCGNSSGKGNNQAAGGVMLANSIPITPSYYTFSADYSPVSSLNASYFRLVKVSLDPAQNRIIIRKADFDDKRWDTSPGGKLLEEFFKPFENRVVPIMVPTISAMAVHSQYFNGSYFYYYDKNNNRGKDYFLSNNLTAVDEIYALDDNTNWNHKHPDIFDQDIMMDIIMNQELMVRDYYLQNRTFDVDRDIECGGKLVVGNNSLALKSYYLMIRLCMTHHLLLPKQKKLCRLEV